MYNQLVDTSTDILVECVPIAGRSSQIESLGLKLRREGHPMWPVVAVASRSVAGNRPCRSRARALRTQRRQDARADAGRKLMDIMDISGFRELSIFKNGTISPLAGIGTTRGKGQT